MIGFFLLKSKRKRPIHSQTKQRGTAKMTDDSTHAVALRIARQVMDDADAEYRANPAVGFRDDVIVRHITGALVEGQRQAAEMVAEAAGAMGRRQA